MSVLASNVMDRVNVLLNDVDKDLYTYTVQLPYLQIANDKFSNELLKNGIGHQKVIAATQTIAKGALTYGTLPADFLFPVVLWERPTNTPNIDFGHMIQRAWEPSEPQTDILRWWVWRNGAINFIGALQDTDVRMDYDRILTSITTSGSTIEVGVLSVNFLAHKTAELCARNIGRNSVRAEELKEEAQMYLDDILNILGKQNQAYPIRKPGFGIRRRR